MRVDDLDFLTESQNYEGMFNAFQPILAQSQKENLPYVISNEIAQEIKWAKGVLRRQDRITWYLRLFRIEVIKKCMLPKFAEDSDAHIKLGALYTRYCKEARIDIDEPFMDFWFRSLSRKLEHFMGLTSCAPVQNYVFDRQHPNDLLDDLKQFEDEWTRTRKQFVDHQPWHEIIMDFPDGFAWVNLNEESCSHEGNAMGHCGNRYGHSGDTVLSLRKRMPDKTWRPSLTFILDKDGLLGEMKGRANQKPKSDYHPHIIALLMHPLVKGIKGGGYEPQFNFSMDDLTEEQRNEIYAKKPELMTMRDYYRLHGYDEKLKNQLEARLEEVTLDEDAQFITLDGKPVLVIAQEEEPMDFLKILGTQKARRLLEYFKKDDFEAYLYDGWMTSLFDRLPGATVNHIMEYVKKHAADEFEEYVEARDYAQAESKDVIDFIDEYHLPPGVYLALKSAFLEGYERGTESECYDLLTNWVQELEVLKVHWDDAGCMLYAPLEVVFDAIDNGTFEEEDTHWGEKPISVDAPYHGFDRFDVDAAIERFYDETPEDFPKFEVPHYTPVANMDFDDVKKELIDDWGWDEDRFERTTGYYKNEPEKQLDHIRNMLNRTRESHWSGNE